MSPSLLSKQHVFHFRLPDESLEHQACSEQMLVVQSVRALVRLLRQQPSHVLRRKQQEYVGLLLNELLVLDNRQRQRMFHRRYEFRHEVGYHS